MIHNDTETVKSEQKKLAGDCIIINGTVIDPYNKTQLSRDIRIKNGRITEIAENITADSKDVIIDATDKYLTTGFFDMHVHFREPGYEKAETFISGANAAMAGGFTGVALMPNTTPCVDNINIFNEIKSRTANLLVEIHQIPAVTIGRKGEEIVEMAPLCQSGALAFSDDGDGIASSQRMRNALEKAREFEVAVMVHSEDPTLSPGVMNESDTSHKLGLAGIPNLSEDIMTARDILLAADTDSKVHFQHVSTKGSVELIRRAKNRGLKVTAEVTPHHFSITDKMVETLSSDYKMKPPLRGTADLEEVCRGLQDGTIDAIATDHAPHAPEKKNVPFDLAPFGILGLETAFAAGLKNLVTKSIITLPELIHKMTVTPREILNLDADLLKVGEMANLVIFDTDTAWTVDRNNLKSLSRNTCFDKEDFHGKIHVVINKGMICES